MPVPLHPSLAQDASTGLACLSSASFEACSHSRAASRSLCPLRGRLTRTLTMSSFGCACMSGLAARPAGSHPDRPREEPAEEQARLSAALASAAASASASVASGRAAARLSVVLTAARAPLFAPGMPLARSLRRSPQYAARASLRAGQVWLVAARLARAASGSYSQPANPPLRGYAATRTSASVPARALGPAQPRRLLDRNEEGHDLRCARRTGRRPGARSDHVPAWCLQSMQWSLAAAI